MREYIPKNISISFDLPEEELELITEYLSEHAGHKITVHTPRRGNMRALCSLAVENAAERAKQLRETVHKDDKTLIELAKLLRLEALPERIEAYDISNFGTEFLTAGMIVCENGKFKKSDYRVFRIKNVDGTDDYASMREALARRLAHLDDKNGSFAELPDLILLDGGKSHVATVKALFKELDIHIPVFGMVKDEHHKTRALTTEDAEINIAREQQLFVLIYKIQEEVHRFTVASMESAKSKTIKRSSLEAIDGIGPAKAKRLLAAFGGKKGVSLADREKLAAVKGITKPDAERVYLYFHPDGKEGTT